MATNAEREARLDLTYSELETLAWAAWFSAPAAPQSMQAEIDSVHEKLLRKRRQLRSFQSSPPPGGQATLET